MEKMKNFLDEYKNDYIKFFCPGRVNLIGEHIDYNGGKVLPYALEYGISAAAKLRKDKKLIFKSRNIPDLVVERDLDDLEYRKEDGWANYPKGVIKEFLDRGYKLNGMEINYYGNIPEGAGLSSSAALEVLTCQVVDELNKLSTEKIDWVTLSQKVENEYIGVNCGVMDQFAVCMGKKDNVILLDCDTLEYEYSTVNIKDCSFVIINSNKSRALADSKYNERRKECESGLEILKKHMDIENLCDIKIDDLDFALSKIEDEVVRKRVRHAITENDRVYRAIETLSSGDEINFGKYMNESHNSLRDDYEVTGFELDTLVDEARNLDGALGSRMTGAGFGGCTITLVRNENLEEFNKKIKENYKEKTGLECEIYHSKIVDGVRVL